MFPEKIFGSTSDGFHANGFFDFCIVSCTEFLVRFQIENQSLDNKDAKTQTIHFQRFTILLYLITEILVDKICFTCFR